MRGLARAAGLAVLAAAATGVAGAAESKEDREARREHEAAVRVALETFKQALREAKTPADRAAAAQRLAAEERDPKIVAELSRLLGDAEPVRLAAMAALATYRGEKQAATALAGALGTHGKSVAALAKNLEALGGVGFEGTIPLVAKHLRHDEDAAAAAAAQAMGGMGSAAAVEALLAVWEELDRGRKKEGDAKKKAEQRLQAAGPSIKESLTRLTGKKFHYADEYRAWWTQNKAAWTPPPEPPPVTCRHFAPPAPAAGPAAPGGAVPPPAPLPGDAPPAEGPPAAAVVLPPIPGVFFRAVNLNGPALVIDGNPWADGSNKEIVTAEGGKPFDARNAPIVPPADAERTRMLRTGLTSAGSLVITLRDLPAGDYLVCAYFWEDGMAEMFDVKLQGKLMASNFSTGGAGRWGRIGPWSTKAMDGTIAVAFSGGAVGVCGVEVWRTAPHAPANAPDADPGGAAEPKPEEAPTPGEATAPAAAPESDDTPKPDGGSPK